MPASAVSQPETAATPARAWCRRRLGAAKGWSSTHVDSDPAHMARSRDRESVLDSTSTTNPTQNGDGEPGDGRVPLPRDSRTRLRVSRPVGCSAHHPALTPRKLPGVTDPVAAISRTAVAGGIPRLIKNVVWSSQPGAGRTALNVIAPASCIPPRFRLAAKTQVVLAGESDFPALVSPTLRGRADQSRARCSAGANPDVTDLAGLPMTLDTRHSVATVRTPSTRRHRTSVV